jgi:hypothetical protein
LDIPSDIILVLILINNNFIAVLRQKAAYCP